MIKSHESGVGGGGGGAVDQINLSTVSPSYLLSPIITCLHIIINTCKYNNPKSIKFATKILEILDWLLFHRRHVQQQLHKILTPIKSK